MYKNFHIGEVTPENEAQYLQQIADLEIKVLNNMLQNGQEGQLFITGKEDVHQYIKSKENIVMVATKNESVIAATYITRGQIPFTYNDITKYFKCGDDYKQYVKQQYSEAEYKKVILEIYAKKVAAYAKARDKILQDNGIDTIDITDSKKIEMIEELIQQELHENQFHEKSIIRDNLNKYMSEEIKKMGVEAQYEQFYWINIKDVTQALYGKSIDAIQLSANIQGYEGKVSKDYEHILELQQHKIYEKPNFNQTQYYSANTQNSIELDTYITDPKARENGLARILVNEGIRKCIQEHFDDSNYTEIFLCSTLHRENISSKYVSEFFGLTDNLFVNRRQGRDREVHICKINKKDAQVYLQNMDKKISVLYGYNPRNVRVSLKEEVRILKDQLCYEIAEISRLRKIKRTTGKYKGTIKSKKSKIEKMQKRIEKIEEYQR